MKKKIILLLTTLFMLTMVACGGSNKPSGVYKDNLGFSEIEFSGNKVRYTSIESNEPTEGTFEIDDNEIIITFDGGTSDKYIWDKENNTLDWMGLGILIFEKE